MAADAPTDFDRVLRVVSHIRETFGYELYDTSFLTPERCEELIQRGSGSCSHFASLSCILLRSLGIPTRIAVGYVTREPLPEGEGPGWLVRARDGHAWIEVHFDGFGWLAFDPTPGDPTAGGATTGWAPLDEKELSALTSNSPQRRRRARTSSLGDWVLQGFVAAWEKLRELGNGAPGGPATGAGRAGLVVGLGLAALGGWLALGRLRRRRGTGLAASPDDGGSPGRAPRQAAGGRHRTSLPDSTAVQGLMGALTSQGLQQRRKETPSAFARRAVHQDHRAEGLLGVLTALIGRATLSRPLKQEDVESVGELTRRLSSTDKDGPGASNVKKP